MNKASNNSSQNYRSRWVRVAGVKFPDQLLTQDEEEALAKLPKGWKTTPKLVADTKIPRAILIRKLNESRVDKVVLGNAQSGIRAWEPKGVAQVLAHMPKVLSRMPKGWCTNIQARERLGVSKGRFLAMAAAKKFTGKKVILNGRIVRIWELASINEVVAERASRGVYGSNARSIKCPQCSHAGTIAEVTQCEQVVPLKGVIKDGEEYSYTAKYSKRMICELADREVYIECTHCGKRWNGIDAFMEEATQAGKHEAVNDNTNNTPNNHEHNNT